MKKIKLLSFVTAMVMSASLSFGTASGYATGDLEVPESEEAAFYSQFNSSNADSGHATGDLEIPESEEAAFYSQFNSSDETPDKIYTLEELFAMSDEEFFALKDAEGLYGEDYYFSIKSDAERVSQCFDIIEYGGISGLLMRSIFDKDVNYTANITEMEIEKLLGDTVEYKIVSPISTDPDYIRDNLLYYGDLFHVVFPEYDLYSQTNNITHKEIIEFAKCWYCVDQVFAIYYYGYNADLSSTPSNEQILEGDVNVDKIVDSVDVEYMEKGLSGELKLTELQMKIADVNGDGTFDELDVEKLKADIAASAEPTVKVIAVPENIEASMYGDVNSDLEVNVADVVVLNLLSIDPDENPLTDVEIANADCHKDGVIDSFDSAILMNYVAQLIEISELGK